MRLTMAQAVVKFLDQQYLEVDGKEIKFVGGVFGIFGHGVVVGLGEALAESGHSIRFYQAKNEQGGAHAAIAFAKQNNRHRIMAVTSSIGPGALNMVTAAATATVNHIPLLLLPGDVFATRQPDPVLQQLERSGDLTISSNDAFKPVSRFFDRITRPEQILSSLIQAFRVLTDPSQAGAVTIALCQDVQGESYDYPDSFFRKRVHHLDRRTPTASQVKRCVEAVRGAKKPLVIVGGGVRYSEAGDSVKKLCNMCSIPFAETQAGKGTLAWDDKMNLGGIGVTGTSAANALAKEADLILSIGTRLGDFTTCSKWLFQNPQCKFVSINLSSYDAVKLDAEPIISDARETVDAILPCLKDYHACWGDEIAQENKKWYEITDKLFSDKNTPLSQASVLGMLNNEILPPETIVISGSGSIPSDMQRIWRTRVRGTYHMEYGFSCMGYEVAAALGCKISSPDKECVAIIGDGAYTMLHTELLTSVQEGKKIIVVVLDNSGFQCIDNLQVSQGIPHFGNQWKKRTEDGLTGSSVKVDYAMNARSWGADGYSVTNVDELFFAMKKALEGKNSAVVDVKVSPKSMTIGYGSWWRVGTASVSDFKETEKAAEEVSQRVKEARKF